MSVLRIPGARWSGFRLLEQLELGLPVICSPCFVTPFPVAEMGDVCRCRRSISWLSLIHPPYTMRVILKVSALSELLFIIKLMLLSPSHHWFWTFAYVFIL